MPPTAGSTASLLAATRATPGIKTQDLQQAVDLYQKATELAHHATAFDDFVRAIELFSLAIAMHADQPRFFFGRGNAFRAVNELECAANDYGHAIALDDRTAAYFANRGACFRKLNQPAKALEDLTAAIDMDSKKAAHYFNRALVLHDHGFFKEATIDLTKTPRKARPASASSTRRSNCAATASASWATCVRYLSFGRRGTGSHAGDARASPRFCCCMTAKCIDDLQRAIQLDGRNATGFASLAQAFLDAGELDDAIEHFGNAIQLHATHATYYALRGLCFYRKCTGRTTTTTTSESHSQSARQCLSDLNQSIKLDGKDPQAYFYRGSIRLALALEGMQPPTLAVSPSDAASLSVEQQLEAAFADTDMAWRLQPTTLKFQIGLAMITQLTHQYERASILLREIHACDRANVVVKFHWALCCHSLGDVETALTLLCDCIDAVAAEPSFFEARGLVLLEATQLELAIGDLTEAIALRAETETKNAWNLYLRAECHLRLEQFGHAIRDASLVLVHAVPTGLETSVRNTRAMANRGLGQYDSAIDDLTVSSNLCIVAGFASCSDWCCCCAVHPDLPATRSAQRHLFLSPRAVPARMRPLLGRTT
jgi:tetratricopeptide (TPR) repeat protein